MRHSHLLAAVLAIAASSALDYFFPGYSGWPIGLIVTLPLAAWLVVRPSRAGALALASIVSWLVLLPLIPWHSYKRFYIVCHDIEIGSSFASVRQKMSDYHLQYDASRVGTRRPDELGLLFHPYRSADWCQVYGRERVERVVISRD